MGVHPSHAGTLLHGQVQSEDVAAQIMQFAVEGAMRITPVERPAGLFGTMRKTWLLQRTPGAEHSLTGARRELFQALFGGDSETTMAQAKRRTGSATRHLRTDLETELDTLGLARRGAFARVVPVALGGAFATFAGLIVLTIAGVVPPGVSSPLFFPVFLVYALGIVFGSRLSRARRTPAGDRAAEDLRSFAAHLGSGDGTLLATPRGAEIYARHLPWAVATGTARTWSHTFAQAARDLAATDRDAVRAWATQLAWFGGAWALHSAGSTGGDSSLSGDSDTSAETFPDPGPVDGLADTDGFGDFGDSVSDFGDSVADFGDSVSDFADSMSDFADSVGDFADSASSDIGSDGGSDGGGGDGGGDGGGGGGD